MLCVCVWFLPSDVGKRSRLGWNLFSRVGSTEAVSQTPARKSAGCGQFFSETTRSHRHDNNTIPFPHHPPLLLCCGLILLAALTAMRTMSLPSSSSPNNINPELSCTILWSPLPPITWILPFIGHMGIADSRGIASDFQGPYYVGDQGKMAFGNPTRALRVDVGHLEGPFVFLCMCMCVRERERHRQ